MYTVKEALTCILTDLINRLLQSLIFASAWKISEVTPLVREGDQ